MPPRTRNTDSENSESYGGVDLTAPTVVNIEQSVKRAGRTSIVEKYPRLVASVKESWDKEQGLSYGPFDSEEDARRFKNLVQLVGKKLECGFSPLRVTEDLRVEFQARNKRSYVGS